MKINKSIVLVTGANRGIGRAYVEAALKGGAQKVYAAAHTAHIVEIMRNIPNFAHIIHFNSRVDYTPEKELEFRKPNS